jgi:exopolysaccharide biosynthesis polyprenyl glycosylphosphotransferase
MSKLLEKILLLLGDFVAVYMASLMLLTMKFAVGMLSSTQEVWSHLSRAIETGPPFSFVLALYWYDALPAISLSWITLFALFGLYRSNRSHSRFDEVTLVFKAAGSGTILLFLVTLDSGLSFTRVLMALYGFALFALVSGSRVAVRSAQRQLLHRGFGRRRAVIVGSDSRGHRLLEDLRSPPEEYDIVGFIRVRDEADHAEIGGIPVLGEVKDLAEVIKREHVVAVLIALRSNTHEEILEIVESARGDEDITFSISPDLYDIVAGHVRTNQIYGAPLMELRPQLMAPWEATLKRVIDVAVALIVLLGFSPLWLSIAVAIKFESKGPVLFRQDRVGKGGRIFTIYKFRSMIESAESDTGPVWAKDEDPRVTRMGKVLRTLHLDEIPQCLNFLKGDMSLVGPRPERPYFVESFTKQIPFYMRRFNVQPGLLGWAQSKHEYDLSARDLARIAEERLEYDLYYIENVSMALDFKIMLRTIWFVLAGKSTR